jgi:hypothetical protein
MYIYVHICSIYSYWNKLVANKAESELLDLYWLLRFGKVAGTRIMIMTVTWAKELPVQQLAAETLWLAGLMFVDPSKDGKTHMQQLLPIENPRGMDGLAKQKFAGS